MIEYAVKGKSIARAVGPMLMGAALVLAVALPGQSLAQSVPATIEGKIGSIVDNGDGTGSMTVMGITVTFDSTVPMNSPSTNLTLAALADPTPLPGRPGYDGFEGGTAIVLGSTAGGPVSATDIFVEPAENVVLGMLTSAANCSLEVQGQIGVPDTGVKLVFLQDARIPAGPALDVQGFEIDPCTIPEGTGVGVEGYYGEDGMLYIFALEAEAGERVNPGVDEVSIQRARCSRGSLDVRGASSDPNGSVIIFDITNADPTTLGEAALVVDPATLEATYRFRSNVGTCPSLIRVTHSDNGATAESEVDLR